ncbi:MAG TPA: hypothetical protein VJM46_01600 [Candidatus Saccharimonadales bacterium]|nr:hypothetical protein [Candidatus Saccharimonadales bacterium]
MDIGNTHVDGSVLVALVLIVGCALAIYMLRNRPKPPITEHASIRAMRLIRSKWRVLEAGQLYFVPDFVDTVYMVAHMSLNERVSHSGGRVVRRKGSQIIMASVEEREDPLNVSDTRFWIID